MSRQFDFRPSDYSLRFSLKGDYRQKVTVHTDSKGKIIKIYFWWRPHSHRQEFRSYILISSYVVFELDILSPKFHPEAILA